jgi:phytoene dehydrogenase-like protein
MTAARYDAVVIGGGVNGLTCAACLAKAGLKTLVLERRAEVGGGAVTAEIAPGFRAPVLAHTAGPLRHDVVEDLALRSHGLEFLTSPVDVLALGGASPLVLWTDPARTAEALKAHSPRDAEGWPRFVRSLAALGRVVGSLFTATPPDVDEASGRALWTLLRTLRAFRRLDRDDAYRLLRWGPMPVADLVGECFETETLRACLAGEAILGTALGPWSAGSGLVLLLKAANEQSGAGSRYAKGGPGAIAAALRGAARKAGVEIRTGAGVARILTTDGRARGVALADGTDIEARAVVSAVDPRQTFLRLCDPIDLAPEFLWRMRHYRAQGTLAKVNLALAALPEIPGIRREWMTGRIRVCPEIDYLERAFDHSKYGRYSPEPYIEFTIPTLLDPALAPDGAHVLSAYVQWAPYALRGQDWDAAREGLLAAALDTLERHVPGLRRLVTARHVVTPLDLERTYGMTGGHIFHGELALDQLLSMRPLLGWGQYRAPIGGLYLCSSGTHPGTGLTGGSGANAAKEILRALR